MTQFGVPEVSFNLWALSVLTKQDSFRDLDSIITRQYSLNDVMNLNPAVTGEIQSCIFLEEGSHCYGVEFVQQLFGICNPIAKGQDWLNIIGHLDPVVSENVSLNRLRDLDPIFTGQDSLNDF